MLLPAAIDLSFGHEDYKVFLICSAISLFFGLALMASGRGQKEAMNLREVMLTVPVTWIVVALFACLPFMFSKFHLSFTDAYFETVSGLTATGSTVIVGLDEAPKGLLLWRFLLVWFGGFGVVTFAIFVLPFLRIGGMQLFSLDLSAQAGRIVPRMTSVVGRIAMVYLGITVLAATSYGLAGMTVFDAIGHAMSTVATGGFSSHDASFAYFNSPLILYIAAFYMLIPAMPFVLYLHVIRGQFRPWLTDSQVRLFLSIVAVSIASVAIWLVTVKDMSWPDALVGATFNVATLISCTGFTAQDFSLWGAFPLILFLMLMLMGGCTGSTTGGIKMFRVCVLFQNVRAQIRRQIYPHISTAVFYNRETVSDPVRSSVVNYYFVYVCTFVVLALLLSAVGMTFEESFSASATALGGVGPGFGPQIGPCCTFSTVPVAGKWLLVGGMLAGRLEILILILPFTALFWRD